MLSDPQRLLEGVMIFEKSDPNKGRLLFNLRELPLGVAFVTDRSITLQRVGDSEVLYGGESPRTASAKSLSDFVSRCSVLTDFSSYSFLR